MIDTQNARAGAQAFYSPQVAQRSRLGNRDARQARLDADRVLADYEFLKRTADDELFGIVGTPAKTIGGFRAEAEADRAERDNGAPRASQESTEPMCSCREEAAGIYTSPATGRRYKPQVTPAGVRYGLEPRTRFVHLEVRGHSVERGSAGWPVVDRFVTQLEAKLQIWTEAVEGVKAYTWRPRDREALDSLVHRWVRWPASWKPTRRRILDVTRHVMFKPNTKREAMFAFQRQAFVESFEP